MESLQKVNNQQLLQELKERVRNKFIQEKELKEVLETRKEQRLSEYEAAANDPEEQQEIKE